MDLLLEQIIIYGIIAILVVGIVVLYMRKNTKDSQKVRKKVQKAKEEGLFEPISLHPYIDLSTCIGSGACITACPEKDILGIVDGVATVINTSQCIGHGACFHACPVEAISLRIGTEKRGVDLPHVNENFETNVAGIYIAGELGGMGLIKNSIEQGKQAMENWISKKTTSQDGIFDALIVGAGPAGISASLTAKKHGLKSVTLEQDSLGGTVFTFPREKVVMTAPVELPLHGKVKLFNTSKDELLELWRTVITQNDIDVRENVKVEQIIPVSEGFFKVQTNTEKEFYTRSVFLTIGRRGSPRKLNIPGEDTQKVAYRLLEPERIKNKKIVVVGGGDSAIESAILLMNQNEVTLSYRKDKFARLKPKNKEQILNAIQENKLSVLYNSNLGSIHDEMVRIRVEDGEIELENDLVYIFAGGELPTKFLQKAGVNITKRFGHVVKSYKKE